MEINEMSQWSVRWIDNVVLVPEHDAGFTLVNGRKIKAFSNRKYHGLVLTNSGSSLYTIAQRYAVHTQCGALTYLPMNQPYTVEVREPGTCFCVNFHIEQESALPSFSFSTKNPARWHRLFTGLLYAWSFQKPGARARQFSLLYEMLACAVEENAAQYLPARQKTAIQRVMEQAERSREAISVSAMARQCDMSETCFRKAFHSLYGTSPKQYLLDARFRQAEVLLSTTAASVSEIASLCGYDNIYAFSRAFATHNGMSPTEYRLKHRER